MKRNTLTINQAERIARLLLKRRQELGLNTREVAQRAGISHGSVNLMERAVNLAPGPEVLRSLAAALDIPLSDLYVLAGWLPADELPSLRPYMRAKYDLTPDELAELDDYLERVQRRHGTASPSGAAPRNDEYH